MVPPLSQKVANFYLPRSKVCIKKFVFSQFLNQFYELAFFYKMLALSNKKSTFALVSGLLAAVFSQFCSLFNRKAT